MWSLLIQRKVGKMGKSIFVGLLAFGLLWTSGCTRRFFQRRADAEVDNILATKDKYAFWRLGDYYVWPHPLSRFADPTDPNRPPMPPDDPAAWDLSPHPQRPIFRGHAYWQGTGYLDLMAKWDKENRAKMEEEKKKTTPVEVEDEKEPTLPGETKTFDQRMAEVDAQILRELNQPVTTTGLKYDDFMGGSDISKSPTSRPFMLNMDQVVQLGFLNSREFQTQREALYLTCLALTAQRFAFIAQPYLTEVLLRQRSGQNSTLGEANNWQSTSNMGFTKMFSTGALLLFNFANQTVYNLGQGLNLTSVSSINLDFVQPFLAGGGRAVALEPLTQAERDVVYAIRDFFRFRQEYFVFWAAGQSVFIPGVTPGASTIIPATVAQPFPFVPGAFISPASVNPAAVQVPTQAPLAANINAGVVVTPQGYLSTIGERATLVNYYKNIQNLQRFLVLLRAYVEGGLANQVQAGSVEQSLLSGISTAISNHATYRISLDQLKQQIGLPITVPIDLDPAPLQPIIDLTTNYEKLFVDTERVTYNSLEFGRALQPKELRARLRRLIERTQLFRDTTTRERILKRWPFWENLARDKSSADRMSALFERVRGLREELFQLRRKRGEQPGETLPEEDLRREKELFFDRDLAELEYALSLYELEPWKGDQKTGVEQRQANEAFRRVHAALLAVAGIAVIERQEQIKKSWPPLPVVCTAGVDLLSAPEDEALLATEKTVMTSRVDLMNVRAQLVDGWRKIRVSANALLGTFNVDYHFASSTPAGLARPFSFQGSNNINQLYLTMSPPLVRILQRNNYRSTLIYFQQTRRALMGYEDQLLFNVRLDLRNLLVAANTVHRVQKRAIELAYQQVDQALQAFSQPQAPPQSGLDPTGLVGPVSARPQVGDPAALTQQLLQTQSSLLSAQNSLYSTWIGYLNARMYFFRDLGTIQFDNRGVWIDDNSSCPCESTETNNGQPSGNGQPNGPDQQQPPQPEQLPQPRTEPAPQEPALEPPQ